MRHLPALKRAGTLWITIALLLSACGGADQTPLAATTAAPEAQPTATTAPDAAPTSAVPTAAVSTAPPVINAPAGQWSPLPMGGALNVDPALEPTQPALAVRATDGLLAAAWVENNQVFVKQFDAEWTLLGGGTVSGEGEASAPSLVYLNDGSLAVAYLEYDANDIAQGFYARWDGAAWTDRGLFDYDSGPVRAIDLAAGAEGPIVARIEDDANGVGLLDVRRWTGADWVPVADAAPLAGDVTTIRAFDLTAFADGAPAIAWVESGDGTYGVQVLRLDASSSQWAALPAQPGAVDADTTFVELAALGTDTLYLAYNWNNGLRGVYAWSLAQNAWSDLGLPHVSLSGAGYLPHADLAAGPFGGIGLVWAGGVVNAATHQEGAWSLVSEQVNTLMESTDTQPHVALGLDGTVYVIFRELGGGQPYQLRVIAFYTG